MLLDTQAVKTILVEIPSLGQQTSGASSYSKFVNREMSKAEALLKVILSPIDSVADTYRALLPEGTPMEFHRILELKVLVGGHKNMRAFLYAPYLSQFSHALFCRKIGGDTITMVKA